jgi:hypothetical protein
MGRWAEVYFTSPPEKREEAVMELLRELQAGASQSQSSLPSTDLESARPESHPFSEGEKIPPPMAEFTPVHTAEEGRPNDGRPRKSLPASGSYRVYAGVILVIAALAFAYVAWRSSRVQSGRSLPAPTPPAATKQSAVPERASGAPTAASGQSSSASNKPVAPLPGAAGTSSQPGTIKGEEKSAPTELRAPAPAETSSQVGTAKVSGAEALAMAKSYLNGTDGKTRDSGEAVKWLWQAVAKQNAEATELLADLYLKGAEVPKNCEQARLLLDAAAHRGVKEAAERLRHLQDSGCE